MASASVGWSRMGVLKTPLVPVALLALLSTFVFIWRLGDRDLWAPDETRNAEVAREMVLSGHWGVPTLNGAPCADHPPLFLWCVAAADLLFGGDNEVSARLPGALAASLTVMLFFLLGRRALGARAALLAGVVFATAVGAIGTARIASPDMLFSSLLTLTMLAFLRAMTDERPARWLALASLTIGLAMLAGGIEGLFLPIGALTVHAFVSRRATMRWCLASTAAGLLGAGMCVAVLLGVSRGAGATCLASLFHAFAREEAWQGLQFLWVVPVAFLPWLFFAPGAFIQLLKDPGTRRGPGGYFVSWAAFAFLWICAFGTRNYLEASLVLPAMAGAIAVFWDFCLSVEATERLRFRVGLPFLTFVLSLPVAGFGVYGQTRAAFPSFESVAMEYGAVLIFMASSLVIFIFWRQTLCRFASLGVSSLIAVSFAAVFVVPRINEVKSERRFFESVKARVPAASELRTLCMPDASHIYYSGRTRVPNIQSVADLEQYFSASGQVYCIMEYDDFLMNRVRGLDCLNLVYKDRAGRKTLAVVTNRSR